MKEITIKGWVVRSDDDTLFLYNTKPRKGVMYWYNEYDDFIELDTNLFPQVKWSDPEPTEVELTIKIKEQ